MQTYTQERHTSLLPWQIAGVVRSALVLGRLRVQEGASTPTKGLVHHNEITAPTSVPHSFSPIINGSVHVQSHSTFKSDGSPAGSGLSIHHHQGLQRPRAQTWKPFHRRPLINFVDTLRSSSTFHCPKRERFNTAPPVVDLGLDQNAKGKPKASKAVRTALRPASV